MKDGLRWDMSRLQGPPQLPGYTLGAPLGSGGFGTVYSATDGAGRQVAVKVLTGQASTRAQARFEREAELLARLRHPGVVVVHAWGRAGPEGAQLSYLVCERIDGRTLDLAAAELDLDGRLALVEQAARAVGAAHALGIVHRDLKPQNILVDGAGRVKVIDFGVSLGEGVERLTNTGQFLGTPLYAPPERLLDDPLADAPTADVWSLAAVAYELVAGEHPYPVEGVLDLARRGTDPPGSPRRRAPALDRGVAALLVRALSPRPADRPPDCGAFAEALAAARAGRARRARASLLVGLGALGALALGGALLAAPRAPAAPAGGAAPASAAAPTSAVPVAAQAAELARRERWAELRALLAGPGDDPALTRLRGLAALHEGDRAAAARDLGPGEPQLAVAEALARLAATAPGAPELMDRAEDALDAARGVGREGPGERATRARLLGAVRDALLVMRPAPDQAAAARREAVVERTARLQDEPDARRGLTTAAWWCELVRAVPITARQNDDWLVENAARCPAPGPWDAGQPATIRAITRCVELVSGGWLPGAPAEEAALEEALRLLPALEGLGAHGGALARAATTAVGVVSRDAACRALRRGQAAEAGRHLARASEALRTLGQGRVEGRREPQEVHLEASLHLVQGRVSQARAVLGTVDGGVAIAVLRIECDLVQRSLEQAGRRLEALLRRADRGRLGIDGLLQRLDLHRRVLAGELTAAEAARRLPPDPTPPPRAAIVRLEWHSAEGLASVLAGGWWPGGGRGAPQER